MTAIFSAPVTVDVKLLATVWASKIVDCFSLYPVKMTVPPGVAAFIAAETFFLLFCYLLDSSPTVLTTGGFTGEYCGRLGRRVPTDIIPSAERLHRVQRYAKRPGNLTIAVSGHSEFNNLRFLIIGHIISAPSEGICLVVSPSLTTEKFNPHRYDTKSGLQALRRDTHRPYLF